MGEWPSIDSRSLGLKAAALLMSTDLSYRPFQKVGQCLLGSLNPTIEQVRLYTLDPDDLHMKEEAVVNPVGVIQGSHVFPLDQLDARIKKGIPVIESTPLNERVTIPISDNLGLAGLLILVGAHQQTENEGICYSQLGESLCFGWRYVLAAREADRSHELLHAATRLSRELQEVSGLDRLLRHFLDELVGHLGFDRATLLVYAEDGKSVQRGLYSEIGCEVQEIQDLGSVPDLGEELSRVDEVHGIWLPMRRGERRLGALLVDNIYSLDPPLPRAERALQDLSHQAAMALQNARLFDRLSKIALRDDLTGLFRPNYFYERTREELARLERTDSSAGMLIIDVDSFKEVNDTYGHPAGDSVLFQVAEIIRFNLRACDIACRMGGDEFVILIPGITGQVGYQMAERLIEQFQRERLKLPDGRSIKVSVSIGLAMYPQDAGEWQQLLNKADGALYMSKRRGKGRVSTA